MSIFYKYTHIVLTFQNFSVRIWNALMHQKRANLSEKRLKMPVFFAFHALFIFKKWGVRGEQSLFRAQRKKEISNEISFFELLYFLDFNFPKGRRAER